MAFSPSPKTSSLQLPLTGGVNKYSKTLQSVTMLGTETCLVPETACMHNTGYHYSIFKSKHITWNTQQKRDHVSYSVPRPIH